MMKNLNIDKKVSIIVPIYNVEKNIYRCIDSIIKQTYTNIEVILVDDGSIDNCPKICDEYTKNDSRIKVIHKKNRGISSARNRGLNMATGEYILFVDGDDYIDEKTVEIIIKKAITNNADIVHFNFECVDEGGNKIKIKNKDLEDNKILTSYETLCGYVKQYKIKVMPWNKLYKSTLFKELRFDEGYVYEDELIFPKIIHKSKKNYTINDKLYYYVHRADSITKSPLNKNKVESKKFLIKSLEEFYLKYYPELIRYIYIAICFICTSTAKQIREANTLDLKYKLDNIKYFNDMYIEIYSKLLKLKMEKDLPIKKEIFCFIINILLILKKYNFLNKKYSKL